MSNRLSQKQALQEAHDSLVAHDAESILFKDSFPDLFLKDFEPYKNKLHAVETPGSHPTRSNFTLSLARA